jgi:hypothetical protein
MCRLGKDKRLEENPRLDKCELALRCTGIGHFLQGLPASFTSPRAVIRSHPSTVSDMCDLRKRKRTNSFGFRISDFGFRDTALALDLLYLHRLPDARRWSRATFAPPVKVAPGLPNAASGRGRPVLLLSFLRPSPRTQKCKTKQAAMERRPPSVVIPPPPCSGPWPPCKGDPLPRGSPFFFPHSNSKQT